MSGPNWKFWVLKDEVASWQAAALSMGIDPHLIHKHPEYWNLPELSIERRWFRNDAQYREFGERRELVEAFNRSLDTNARINYRLRGLTTLAGFARWAVSNGLDVPPEMRALDSAPSAGQSGIDAGSSLQDVVAYEYAPDVDAPAPVKGRNPSHAWQAEARRIAGRLHLNDVAQKAHDSTENLADRVASELREREIYGPHGPVSGATVVREAINGRLWKRPLPASGKSGSSGGSKSGSSG